MFLYVRLRFLRHKVDEALYIEHAHSLTLDVMASTSETEHFLADDGTPVVNAGKLTNMIPAA
jgi:hypothetical protein